MKKIQFLNLMFIAVMLLPCLTGCADKKNKPSIMENGYVMPSNNENSYNITFLCPIIENPYWERCIKGIERADAELGTHTKVSGPKSVDGYPDELPIYLEQAIEEHPDGIMGYSGMDILTPGIDKAREKGIPYISIDSNALTESSMAFVGTDLYAIGYTAGEALVNQSEKNISIGFICSYKSAINEMNIYHGFIDAVHDFNVKVIAEAEGHNDIEYAAEVMKNMLKKYPKIKAVFCTGGYNVTGAGRYLKESGRDDIILVGMEDTEENIRLLRNGYIDALVAQSPEEMGYIGVYIMKEAIENGSLPEKKYGTSSILITRDNIDSYSHNEFSPNLEFKTVRIGYYDGDRAFQDGFADELRKSGYAYEYYQAISTIAGWKYEYIYGNRNDAINMLRTGEADIVAGVYDSDNSGGEFMLTKTDMGISEPMRYFAVSAGRPDLLGELEGAMQQLLRVKPYFTADLYTKYYGHGITNNVLTESDRDYLSNLKELRFGYVRGNLPLCDEDENGDPLGLIKEMILFIADFTKLPIKPIAYNSISEMNKALANGETDVSFPNYSDIWLNEQMGFRQTDSFVSDRVMVVYSGNYSDDMLDDVAINEKGIGQSYYMSAAYPEAKLTLYQSREEVFRAVRAGKHRCTVGYASIGQRYIFEHSEYNDMHIAYLGGTVELGFSVNERHSYLAGILNKAIANMGSAAVTSAVLSYTGAEKDITLADFIRLHSLMFIGVLSAVLAFIVFAFLMYYRQSVKFNAMQEKSRHDLAEALDKANTANKAKTRFLSSMSHDIRTPMNAIIGMVSIAEMYPDNLDRLHECLGKIKVSGQRLLTLINDILDVSKIESGAMVFASAEFSLTKLIDDMRTVIENSASEKQINLTVTAENISHDIIVADRLRLEQVYMNLLSNAIKYTPNGGSVTVTFRETPNEEQTAACLTYIVEDTGMGMSKEFMEIMYDLFSRETDSRINTIQGTGLGLTIVKQMVDLMDGTISCESKENVGTKFVVELYVELGTEIIESSKDKSCENILNGLHVLVAEDNDVNWEIAREILGMYGIKSDRAENGQVCIDMLNASESGEYDLVLMDVQMPVLNGKDAARKLRKSERDDIRNIPVIAMTADAFAEDVTDCLDAGMNAHIAKPIETDKLKQTISKVMTRAASAAKNCSG